MIELRMRKWEMRGAGGNHHENLGFNRISCARQFTIPTTAGTSTDLVCTNTHTRTSKPNQASCTTDFSYLVICSTLLLTSSPSLSFSFTTLPLLQNTMSSHPSLSLHAMIMSWHQVQLTLCTITTQDCLSSLYFHDYELTPECSFSFRHTSLHDRPPFVCFRWKLKDKFILSHSHGCKVTNWWTESHRPAHRQLTASNYSANLAWLQPPSVPSNLPNHGLWVYL